MQPACPIEHPRPAARSVTGNTDRREREPAGLLAVPRRDRSRLSLTCRCARSWASRMYCACVQASGVAEKVGVPGANPSSRRVRRCPTPAREQVAGVRGGGHRRAAALRRREITGRDVVLPPLAVEQRPAAPAGDEGVRRAAERSTHRRWPLAVAVEGRAVPELPARVSVGQLPVDDLDAVAHGRIVGGSTPSRTSSRKLGSTTVRWSAALGPLSPIE